MVEGGDKKGLKQIFLDEILTWSNRKEIAGRQVKE